MEAFDALLAVMSMCFQVMYRRLRWGTRSLTRVGRMAEHPVARLVLLAIVVPQASVSLCVPG